MERERERERERTIEKRTVKKIQCTIREKGTGSSLVYKSNVLLVYFIKQNLTFFVFQFGVIFGS